MSSKKRSKIIVGCLLLMIGVFYLYSYLYQDHRNIQQEAVEISISASDLVTLFNENNKKRNDLHTKDNTSINRLSTVCEGINLA